MSGFGAVLQGLAAAMGGAAPVAQGMHDQAVYDQQLGEARRDQRWQQNLEFTRRRGEARENNALKERELEVERKRAEAGLINAKAGMMNARTREAEVSARSSDNPNLERANARVKRALDALDAMNDDGGGLDRTDDELDQIARRFGFMGGFDEVVAVADRTQEWRPTPRALGSIRAAAEASGIPMPMDTTPMPQMGGSGLYQPPSGGVQTTTASNPPMPGPTIPTPGVPNIGATPDEQARIDRLRSLQGP